MSNPNKKFKVLYEFSIPKKVSAEKTVDNGDGTKTITTVTEDVSQYFALKKPSMDDYDNSELFYAATVQEGVSAGMPIRSLLDKRYKDDGGFLSKSEQEEKENLYKKLIELRSDKVAIDTKEEKNEEDATQLVDIEKQTEVIANRLQQYALHESSMYNTTAETRARNKTVIWWMITLLHRKEGEKYVPVFSGATHKERLINYSNIEDLEGDEKNYYDLILNKAILSSSLFYSTGSVTDKEIEEIEKKSI